MSLSKRMVDVNEPNLTLAELQWSLERLRDKSATPDQSVSNALHKDVWIYRIVVITLGLAVLISLVGALVLALLWKRTKFRSNRGDRFSGCRRYGRAAGSIST